MTKMSSLGKFLKDFEDKNIYLQTLRDKIRTLIKEDKTEIYIDIDEAYLKILPFIKINLDTSFDYDNNLFEMMFSKRDKSICFHIAKESIKCFTVWASIELDHYGCVEISDYDKPQIWKWLEE